MPTLTESVTSLRGHTTYHDPVTVANSFHTSMLVDSPFARELERGVWRRCFAPPLETQYIQERLAEGRLVIRVACVLSALIVLLRGVELLHAGSRELWTLLDLAIVGVISVALAFISCSPWYRGRYMAWARILVPARNSIVAAQVAVLAVHGQMDMLMVLPLMLFGPFFFLGLRYRAALLCSIVTVLAYGISATVWDMPQPVATRSYAFLLIGLLGFTLVARHLERSSRLAFLEGGIITALAQHDSLTGTKNRRVFDERLTDLWQRAAEQHRSIAVLLVDIDHFKAYNDRYGHQAGDQTLRRVAQAIGHFVRRPGDVLARYGGEEFAAVLYDTDTREAAEMAERMRRAVADMHIEHHGSDISRRVTISVGVAAVAPNLSRSASGALQLADEALYQAKVWGRDRVEIRDELQHDLVVTGVFASCQAVTRPEARIF
jgi:diguanylate cyclase (GGDEF)-like protein